MWRKVFKCTIFAAILAFPSEGFSGDLSDTLEFVQNHSNGELVDQYEERVEKDRVSILGLLEARDVPADKRLEEYDCIEDGKMDRFWAPKYGFLQNRLMARYCVEAQFRQGQVRGYRTLGSLQLNHRQLAPAIRRAAQSAGVSEILVREIIALSSGYRPGEVSDAGRLGLMQIHPHIAERFGADNPLDPVQNIRAGAAYLAHLIEKWSSLPLALAEYRGASEEELSNGNVPTRRSLIWWVRAIAKQYEVESQDFPEDLGWENIALVAGWLH